MKYRLVSTGRHRPGIYKEGGGYIINPRTTLFFPDEVKAIFTGMVAHDVVPSDHPMSRCATTPVTVASPYYGDYPTYCAAKSKSRISLKD